MKRLKKFKFSLEVLLKVKNAEKKEIDNELYYINQKLLHMKQELKRLEDKTKANDESMQIALRDGIDVYTLKNYGLYRSQLTERSRQQLSNIEHVDNKAENLRKKYITLNKELDILEKLKRQQFIDYQYDIAQRQAKEIEDIISCKVSRGAKYGNIK